MKKTKVVHLIKSCEPSELYDLEQFITSSYYNQDETIIRLFHYLKAAYPNFDAPMLAKKNIFQQVFPGQAYDDKQLRYLMSNLSKLIERFLAIREIEEQPYQLTLALLKNLSERGLYKSYDQVTRLLEQKVTATMEKNSVFFLTQLQWSEIREHHFQRQRIRKFDANLQHFADDLDKYYFLQRLKIACAMLDRQTIFQAAYTLNFSEAWIQHLEQQDFFGEPVIRVYYTIFQALLKEEEEDHFAVLKKLLNTDASSIAADDLTDMYLFAINYCARKIRQGKEAYVSEALHFYRTGIERGLLIDKEGLSPWAFTNVIKLSLRLQEYNWIEF
ncbi:MAG: hypothetical protein SFU99_01875, partial [Saprospiraceae bacterium]|nr:hypothetical protein [Saprospiraceae bacterium]